MGRAAVTWGMVVWAEAPEMHTPWTQHGLRCAIYRPQVMSPEVEGTGLNIGHEAGEYWGTGVRGPTCRCEVFGFALRKGEASEGM